MMVSEVPWDKKNVQNVSDVVSLVWKCTDYRVYLMW